MFKKLILLSSLLSSFSYTVYSSNISEILENNISNQLSTTLPDSTDNAKVLNDLMRIADNYDDRARSYSEQRSREIHLHDMAELHTHTHARNAYFDRVRALYETPITARLNLTEMYNKRNINNH